MNFPFRLACLLVLASTLASGCFVKINDFEPSTIEDDGQGGAGPGPEDDGEEEPRTLSTCGNDKVEEGEDCDDGNTVTEPCTYGQEACTVCSKECQEGPGLPHFCGDGAVDESEDCDEGDDNGGGCKYGSTESCTVCTTACEEKTSEARYCGDGSTNAADDEVCDDGELNGTGPGTCAKDCLSVQTCGDGIKQGTELCDDGENNGTEDNCDLRCGLPWFVDVSAADGGDGNGWATAFNKLATAVSAASAFSGGEIWVRAGEYVGNTYFREPVAALTLAPNVSVYGGFDGTETLRTERDWTENKTYLTRGSHNVVLASHTVVDGFYITEGDAKSEYEDAGGIDFDAEGGGIYGENATNVILRNLVVQGNYGFLGGGGISLKASAVVIRNVLFDANTAGPGGVAGARFTGGNVEIHASRFVNHTYANGPGALHVAGAVFKMEDTDFLFNTNSMEGPVALSELSGTARITNCLFAGNWAAPDGGYGVLAANALVVGDSSNVIITNVSFIENDQNGVPDHPDVRGGSGAEIHNAFVYHLWPETTYVGVTVESSCSEVYGPSSKPPTVLDRDEDGFMEYYLHPLGSCVDTGDNTAADLAGLDWENLTTSETDCLDTGQVDGGRHYAPLSGNVGPCN